MSEADPTIYLIGGVPRTGKSSLARRLVRKLGILNTDTDDLQALFNPFPQLRIGYYGNPHIQEVMGNFRPSLEHFIGKVVAGGESMVIHGQAIDPAIAVKCEQSPHIRSCFMGMSNAEASFASIRQHEKPQDWTAHESDDSLRFLVGAFAERSHVLEQTCHALGLLYVDTTPNMVHALHTAYEHLTTPVAS